MRLSIESDGDRYPKDVYLVDEKGSRIATMEFNGSENRMFDLARRLAFGFNFTEAKLAECESAARKDR